VSGKGHERENSGVGVPVSLNLSSKSPTDITIHIKIEPSPGAISETKPGVTQLTTQETKARSRAGQRLGQACTEAVVTLFNHNLPDPSDAYQLNAEVFSAIMDLENETDKFLDVFGWDGREELETQVGLVRKRLEEIPGIQNRSLVEWDRCREIMSRLLTETVNNYYFYKARKPETA
jgi:hypothetical protein